MSRRGASAVVVAGVTLMATACDSTPARESACDDLRAELESLTPEASAESAWEDITVLQESVERALFLEAEIERLCE